MIGLQKVFVFSRLNGTKPWPDEFWKTRFTVTKITDSIKANVNRLKCVECLTSSLPWLQTIYWKKVSVIAFRNIAPKILPVVHISSLIFTTYLKKFIGIKSISTKQCPAELSPWIIPPVSPIEESRPVAKKCSFITPAKSHSSNSNFHVITQYKLHL